MSKKIDKGHKNLIDDLRELLSLAENFHFHDFKSKKAAPKVALMGRVFALKDNIEEGRYDN